MPEMTRQDTPTVPHFPDYGPLRQATFGKDMSSVDDQIDQALDGALPDNPLNSTLPQLKSLVRQFMSRRDEHGRTMLPCAHQAMLGVNEVINTNPQLANAELVRSLTNTALHSGECTKSGDHEYHVDARQFNDSTVGEMERLDAVRAIGTIMDKRPDLADAALVKNVSSIAANDPDSGVRSNAQYVLGKIADKRPALIDADMVKVASHTAAQPIADHEKNTGSRVEAPKDEGKIILGTQDDGCDNDARGIAQHTLQTIKDKRPDMFAKPERAAAAQKQNSAAPHLHTTIAAPRPSIGPSNL
jgi:hypothetical protein